MNFEQIMNEIRSLSRSQGFYGRLLRDIESLSAESLEAFKSAMEEQNFESAVDMVLFFET